jgi:isocitrate dehydrogenase (NAD+)
MADELKIIVLEGDQTGQELLDQAIRVLDPNVTKVDVSFEHYDLSLENRRKTDNEVVIAAARAMAEAGYGLKAATITPEGAEDVGSPNRILREEIDGTVIIRTGRRIPGVTPIAGVHYPISVVRMAVGDAYGAKQWREVIEDGDVIAFRTERISRTVCRAVAEHSFRTARKIHGRVYGGPKWTVSPVYEGLLKEEMDAASERHPEVPYQPVLIDATYAGLVGGAADAPLVIPALNRDGDCLSDMVLPLFGSIAGAESVLLALDDSYTVKTVMAEAPHGTAPQLEGKNVANPMAMIMAGAALLHYIAEKDRPDADLASRAIYESVLEATATGIRTFDLGGTATMSEFTDEVISRVRTKIDIWSSLGTTV